MEQDKKVKVIFNIMAIALIIILAFALTPKTLQNDTYYTISLGKYVLENGITMTDPFSWHENLTYTFPHWAYDVCIYFVYDLGGFSGIYISTMILAAILGILIYFTTSKLMSNRVISFLIAIAALYLLRNFITARAQLVTFILFLLTIYYIEQFLKTKKWRYAIGLIIIPILIANFHAATFYFYFILYMPYIAEYIIHILSRLNISEIKVKHLKRRISKKTQEDKKLQRKLEKTERKSKNTAIAIEKRKNKVPYKIRIDINPNIKYLIIIMVVCLFTGLLTPQTTFEPYTHLVKLMLGDSTKSIAEHQPLTLVYDVKFAVAIVLFIAIIAFTDTKIRLCDLFMLAGLVTLTFITRRQESLFTLMCSIIFIRLVCELLGNHDPTGTTKLEKNMTKIGGIFITVLIIGYMSFQLYEEKKDTEYIDQTNYPVQACNWILKYLDLEDVKLFNDYNYGSYLLYRGIPVFVDSRCDLYTPEFNKKRDILNDYFKLSSLQTDKYKVESDKYGYLIRVMPNLEAKFDEYGITHIMTYQDSGLTSYMMQNTLKYEQIYSDDIFCIYKRK